MNELQNIKNRFGIIGNFPALNRALEKAIQVAPTDISVLVIGESGVGKEFIPKIIHSESKRKHQPYIVVNCGAIPEGTIDSELFGHEKGAFTSAIATRKGKFELAEGGTIFLDEIGDMSSSAQAKVLRALQENKITRVGGDKEIKVNVRIIAATNKDLKKEIEKGEFREDLFHRLNVIPIQVPSLNERIEDIPLLANHFLNLICTDHGVALKKITKEAINELQNRNWTGNIREFRNVIERLIILCDKEITQADVIHYS